MQTDCSLSHHTHNKATQAGLVSHYSQIADSTKCPIIVYNVPGRTGCNVLPETMAELFKTKEKYRGTQGSYRKSGTGFKDNVSDRRKA